MKRLLAVLLSRRSALRWACELAGISAVAIAAGMVNMAFGVAVAGGYLLLLANTGED